MSHRASKRLMAFGQGHPNLLLGNHHLDDPTGAVTLFRVPGDQRLPEGGGSRDVDRVGAPEAEPAGEDGGASRQNVVYRDDAKRRQSQESLDGTLRQTWRPGAACDGAGISGSRSAGAMTSPPSLRWRVSQARLAAWCTS